MLLKPYYYFFYRLYVFFKKQEQKRFLRYTKEGAATLVIIVLQMLNVLAIAMFIDFESKNIRVLFIILLCSIAYIFNDRLFTIKDRHLKIEKMFKNEKKVHKRIWLVVFWTYFICSLYFLDWAFTKKNMEKKRQEQQQDEWVAPVIPKVKK